MRADRVAALAVSVFFMVLAASPCHAVGVFGKTFHIPQPDGSSLPVRVFGDELHRDMETLDGYTLVRDPGTGWACYAMLAEDGARLLSTGVPAGFADPTALGVPSGAAFQGGHSHLNSR